MNKTMTLIDNDMEFISSAISEEALDSKQAVLEEDGEFVELDELEVIDESGTNKIKNEEVQELSETTLSYYMQRIAGSTPLSKENEQELGRRIREGDKDAFDQLVSANLKFVIKVAYKFRNSGLPMTDIISQGNLGLLEAAKRYDPDRGVKFISYAVWWIRQYIVQGIAEQSGTVRLPIKQVGNLFKINNAKEKLHNEFGREATTRELAEYLLMNEDDVADILRVSKQSLSLETPLKEGEGRTFADYLESKEEGVEESIMKKNLQSILGDMIEELDTREQQIINLRFGFEDENILTLDEIGKIFGVSRERVRQLENRAIDKLRKKAAKKGLQFYLAS